MTDRSFTDEELALIIRRAAQVHDKDPVSRHSLEDVQEIAAQVGLPRELVAAVARDVAFGDTDRGKLRSVLGPTGHFVATHVTARRVTPEDYPDLVDLIRTQLKTSGHVAQVGSTFEWSLSELHGDRVGSMIITVKPVRAGASVRIEANLLPMRRNLYVAAAFAGVVFGLIASAESGAAPLIVAASAISASIAGWALARGVWPRFLRAAEARAGRLLQVIVAHLDQSRDAEDGVP